VAVYRLSCGIQATTAFPRDRVYINPHFETTTVLIADDADRLCEDLADALMGWVLYAGSWEISVKAYKAEGVPPHKPVGAAVRNPGAAGAAGQPRELACCLSFYAGTNSPSRRGRLYIPLFVVSAQQATERIGVPVRGKVGQLPAIFAALGGADVDWVVWSKTNGQANKVTNWFVDDEWDTVRRRGLKALTRDTGSTGG